MGAVLTLRRQGPCQWLQWQADARTYRCGVLATTDPACLPSQAPAWKRWWMQGLHKAARRWIAAGQGCDCSMEDALPDPRQR